MHGNDINLTECEDYEVKAVRCTSTDQLSECEDYEVEETTELERPWRTITWESEKKKELMETIKTYKPTVSSVSQARVLLIGPVGAGKSSFFNSINYIYISIYLTISLTPAKGLHRAHKAGGEAECYPQKGQLNGDSSAGPGH
ncbi:interferon-induced protein 44-like isoform X2 [Perca fluviatilis]|uniref:interferon-induced protein 44-like isoform X2 n=1 Tax=Perca fluviatilis TaxID=8168 RepID=UPI001964BA00|nr:interferon-induced protein 44-like isoform X2 [Perca fluviatilis]